MHKKDNIIILCFYKLDQKKKEIQIDIDNYKRGDASIIIK